MKKKKLLLFKHTESAVYLRTSCASILTSRLSVGFLTIWTMIDVYIWCLFFFNTHAAAIYEGKYYISLIPSPNMQACN